MSEESFKRKLTTMFSADVVGYSRLMAEDETETLKTLKAYREILSELIKQHRGRVVDSPGDNVLAEFTSVVDGVQCAVAVQKELQARNAQLPEDRRMEFRIGDLHYLYSNWALPSSGRLVLVVAISAVGSLHRVFHLDGCNRLAMAFWERKK